MSLNRTPLNQRSRGQAPPPPPPPEDSEEEEEEEGEEVNFRMHSFSFMLQRKKERAERRLRCSFVPLLW